MTLSKALKTMLWINADDVGRTCAETDAALRCVRRGRLTSVSAMVFMDDSERAAELLRDEGIPVGIHVNFTEAFSAPAVPASVSASQSRVRPFLASHKYAMLIYNPFLRKDFRVLYEYQCEEFMRLYQREPMHVDGHEHMHLCTNMLASGLIRQGQRVRRQQSFWPDQGRLLNRTYRGLIDQFLVRQYETVDHFLELAHYVEGSRMVKVAELARTNTVEVMAHPAMPAEYSYLMSDDFGQLLKGLTAR